MPLDYLVSKDSFESVDENFRSLYVEDGESFRLDVNGVKTQADIDAMKKAKDAEKQEHSETKNKYNMSKTELVKLQGEIATLKAMGKNTDDEAIKKQIEEAVNVRSQPFVEEKQSLLDQLKQLQDENLGFKKSHKESLLDKKINSIINVKNSKFKPEAFQSIKNAAIVSGIVDNYNDSLKDFVDPETSQNFEKWVNSYSENTLWIKASESAGANGGTKGIGTKKGPLTPQELMEEQWGGK